MSIEVKVPTLPESVADAVVVSWHKTVGDTVKRDESLVDIETDKVVLEVPSPVDGVVREILQQEGATVVADQMLAKIEALSSTDKNNKKAKIEEAVSDQLSEKLQDAEVIIAPAAKKMMIENDVSINNVTGTGKHGRILKEDVKKYLSEKSLATDSSKTITDDINDADDVRINTSERIEKRVPMTRLRARIAERLLDAQTNAAILTTFNEVNMQPVMDLRKKYQEKFEQEYGIKLGFMSLFIKASIEALRKFPTVNASIDGNDIVYHGYFDVAVAVSSPRGLVVPVIRNADQLTLAEIEKTIAAYVEKAKLNKIAIEDMIGGTFTLSNGGVFGSLLSTPILNPPQSGILGMHSIQQRAIVEEGEIVARPMMYIALSYDHRIIDGKEAVQFLVAIKECLEDPARMILGI